jgi:hypothetical protein
MSRQRGEATGPCAAASPTAATGIGDTDTRRRSAKNLRRNSLAIRPMVKQFSQDGN